MKYLNLYVLLRYEILMLLCLIIEQSVTAQWSTDPAINKSVCTAGNDQFLPTIASDGKGGAIITWEDYRSGNYNIYAQRINSNGVEQWTVNGIAICTATKDQTVPKIIDDGEGGAIITWNDFRSGTYSDIYAQRIDANGSMQWTSNGVPVCTVVNNQASPVIVSDGEGGAIITWHDSRNGKDIYAQRISEAGQILWAADGIAISTAADKQENPSIATDGGGGAIITWQDNRSGNYDIYAQRINASGMVLWVADGIAICNESYNQVYPSIMSNRTGETIISWTDIRNGIASDIYSQRIIVSGDVQWTNNGVAICTATNGQSFPVMTSDGEGGAIIAWWDYRSGNWDIYSRRILVNGTVQWTDNGVAISVGSSAQMDPAIASDSNGGAIITWRDDRTGGYDNYAQRIDANGSVQWSENGIAISTAANNNYPPSILSDGTGGAIITWWDYRNGSSSDIYAQQISFNGQLGVVTEVIKNPAGHSGTIQLDQNYPNPFSDKTTIRFQIHHSSEVVLKVLNSTGKEVVTLFNGIREPGEYEICWDASDSASGLYFCQIRTGDLVKTKKLIILR